MHGDHRTATEGDNAGAEWLAAEARALGGDIAVEEFPVERLDPVAAYLEIGGERIPAIPAFDAPASEFVYTFIGESCCLPVRLAGGAVADLGGRPIGLYLEQPPGDGQWRLYVRPSRLRLGAEAAQASNRLRAELHFLEFLGDTYRHHLKAGEVELFCDRAGEPAYALGQTVEVGWHSADMRAYG